jgi:hypothetical protein
MSVVEGCGSDVEAPSDVEHCYICMDPVSPADRVARVCKCKSLVMHLECQRRLCAEAAAGSSDGTCSVCRQPYSNVQVQRPVPRPTLALLYVAGGLLSIPVVVVLLVLNETAWLAPSRYGIIRDAQQVATVAAAVLVALCIFYGLRQVVHHRHRLATTAVWLHRPQSKVKVLRPAELPSEPPQPPASSSTATAAPTAYVELQP